MLISNIDIPKHNGLNISSLAFFISIAIKCSENFLCKWYSGSETNRFLLLSDVISLISLRFLTFSIVIPKTELFNCLKKFFSHSFCAFFLSSVFMLIYDFNQSFWINWIALCTFFSFNPWFNACFKALIWIIYFSLSSILQIRFSTFSTFFLSGKNGKSLWSSNNVFGYSTSTSKISYIIIFIIFFIKSSLNWDRSSTDLKTFVESFLRHCPSIQIVCI